MQEHRTYDEGDEMWLQTKRRPYVQAGASER